MDYQGQIIPQQLVNVLEAYRDRPDLIAISSDITRLNRDNILEMSRWAYETLGIAHFRKHLYFSGFAQANREMVSLTHAEAIELDKTIYAFDKQYGYEYPAAAQIADEYSFDMRRFLNNNRNPDGFPIRIFSHYISGFYHSSDGVVPKFGFKRGIQLALRDFRRSVVDLRGLLKQILEHIRFFSTMEERLQMIEASFQMDQGTPSGSFRKFSHP